MSIWDYMTCSAVALRAMARFFTFDFVGSRRSLRALLLERFLGGEGGQTSFLILLLLLPLACNRSDDSADTGELICSDDDPFDIDQCPDSYPDLECTVYVDGDVESSGEGWSWDSAVKTVQEGVDLAYCGAEVAGICAEWEVWVKEGTYYIHKGCREHSVRMRERTALLGGFDGTETNEWDRDWETNKTTLNGKDSADGENQVYHLVRGSDNATIDGFTVTGGRANDEGSFSVHAAGGGMSNYYASPTIKNCVFEQNYATWGSAIDNFYSTGSSSTTINNCVIRENSQKNGTISSFMASVSVANTEIHDNSGTEGGAIQVEESDLSLVGSVIEQNTANYLGGGLIAVNNSIINIDDCLFLDNWTGGWGGAITVVNAHLNLSNTTLSGNSSTNSSGALYMHESSGSIQNSTFIDNSAVFNAGGAMFAMSSVEVDSVVFENNSSDKGGGVHNYMSDTTFSNSVFAGNSATSADDLDEQKGKGGGIHSEGSITSIVNCTFYGNEATLGGSSVHSTNLLDTDNNNQLYEDATTVVNTIAWGNGDLDIGWDDGEPVVTYSDVLDGFTGDGNIDADPLFVNAAGGDLHLAAGSPCIGAADPAAAPETDIEGNIRDGEPDMGAYEF